MIQKYNIYKVLWQAINKVRTMNIEKLKNYWYPIARAGEIKNKPVSKKLLGFDIVIVKLQNKLYAYEDRCPHRNVPLSNGFIKNNKLNCGYHGWQFGLDL